MKKLFLLAAALFSMTTASFALEQGDDNGFGIKLNVGLCGDKFGRTEYDTDVEINGQKIDGNNDDFKNPLVERSNTPMFGLGLDSRWYVATPGNFGIAISARWVDFALGKSKIGYNDPLGKLSNDVDVLKGTTIKADVLMPGVIGTYYLGNDMAIDAYYSLGVGLGFQTFKLADENLDAAYQAVASKLGFDIDDTDFELGLSQYLGAAFRYKVFQAGVEFNFAKLKSMDWFEGDDDEEVLGNFFGDLVTRTRRNTLRIFIGFKF